MNILEEHEIFEIEVLEKLKNAKLLEPLVFGGGTMLRLCYEINRYSADLDLWFIKGVNERSFFKKISTFLSKDYELTDAKIKFYTLLLEIRSKDHPRRLKIEIRKEVKKCDVQERIAFSKYSTKQVVLKVHTLEQTMKNKVEAALERQEIRDFFDIEFLLRKGVPLEVPVDKAEALRKRIAGFKGNDFKVTLGAIVGAETRKYYVKEGFSYLLQRISDKRI